MRQLFIFTAALVIPSLPVPALAQSQPQQPQAAQAQDGALLSEGEVRRIDRDAGKITLRHGPLKNLGMPAMTMVFQVADPAMLDTVKTGDKVRFAADRIKGAYTVISIEPLP